MPVGESEQPIDSVTLSVINNGFVNLCREMGTAMMRTSYSTIFNEGRDFSCVLFNRAGDLIGQAEFCPTMLGSAQYAAKWTIEELGYDRFAQGGVNPAARDARSLRCGISHPRRQSADGLFGALHARGNLRDTRRGLCR